MDETQNNAKLTRIDGSAKKRSYVPPAWLTSWQVQYRVPVSLDEVRLEAKRVEMGLEPAPAQDIARAIDTITEFLAEAGILKGDTPALIKAYADVLGDVPADMLPNLVSGFIRTWKFHYAPLPADLRAIVSEDIAKRQFVRMRLRTAAIRLGSDL